MRRKGTVDVVPIESPDGVRVIFTLPVEYVTTVGTLRGMKITADGATYIELPPAEVEFTTAPLPGDSLSFEVVPL